jgi:hypothetical protein
LSAKPRPGPSVSDQALYPGTGGHLVSPGMVRAYTEQIDLIARLVANLPEQPASRIQRVRLRLISNELYRRAED